ncbi:MAG: phosphoribosyltransferase [Promethearchaeota archaeon]
MNPKFLNLTDYGNIIEVPLQGVIDHRRPETYEQILSSQLSKDERFSRLLIPPDVIKHRIQELAAEIIKDNIENPKFNLLMVLTGAFMFAADLGREIFRQNGPDIQYFTMKLSTYRKEIKKVGETIREVDIQLDCGDIEGEHVIIVEDIIDQGFTLSELQKFLIEEKKAASVKICTLLYKRLEQPTQEVKEIRTNLNIDYIGFTIPDVWVAGYGIDSGDDFRQLPFVIAVNEDYYRRK